MVDTDGALARIAAKQHGLVTAADLREIGMTPKMIEVRVRRGQLHRVHRGVYAVGWPPATREAHWLAAVLACGRGAVLSHQSAAALLGIREGSSTLIEVSTPARQGRRHAGVRVHGSALLAPAEKTRRSGIPVTSPARTIVDLASVIGFGALEYAIHRAQIANLVGPDELREQTARLRGYRGVAQVRLLIDPGESELDRLAKSRSERRMLAICRRHGLPPPRVNAWIPLPIAAGGVEVDFSWPEARLAVEVDGREVHSTMRAFVNDRARDRALTAAGWRPMRYPATELRDNADGVGEELRARLAELPTRAEGPSATERPEMRRSGA